MNSPAGTALIDRYDAWAMTVDDFAPVKIQHDVTALVRDPADPERGLLTADGSGVTYTCRVDLLAVDAADEYWVVRHQIVDDWRSGGGVAARRGGDRGLLGVGAGLHRHGDRGHHPQRGSYSTARGTSRRRSGRDGQAHHGGPARTQRGWPLDPAARASSGSRVPAGRWRPHRAAHRGDLAPHPDSAQPRRDRGRRKPDGGRSYRDDRLHRPSIRVQARTVWHANSGRRV